MGTPFDILLGFDLCVWRNTLKVYMERARVVSGSHPDLLRRTDPSSLDIVTAIVLVQHLLSCFDSSFMIVLTFPLRQIGKLHLLIV